MHRSVSRFTVAILFTALSVARSAAQQEDFTIVVLPDTQYYSARYPAIFSSQTRWIADHRTALNIQFVIGEGDIVDDAESTAQWDAADSAVSVLDAAHVPYALAIGNHDYDEEKPSARSAIAFNSRFGPRRYQKYGWYQSGYP